MQTNVTSRLWTLQFDHLFPKNEKQPALKDSSLQELFSGLRIWEASPESFDKGSLMNVQKPSFLPVVASLLAEEKATSVEKMLDMDESTSAEVKTTSRWEASASQIWAHLLLGEQVLDSRF